MSIDVTDLVDNLLDEQARLNSAVDDGDMNNAVTDSNVLGGDAVGFTGAETVTATSTGSPPHKWDDGQTQWNFAAWA